MYISYSPLSSLDISHVLRNNRFTKAVFLGVFAADTLPETLKKKPCALVANCDTSDKNGSHWIAIYIDKSGKGEFFDSYGIKPIVSQHENFMNKHCNSWTFNTVSLQDISTSVCGQYCCLYTLAHAKKYSTKYFLKHYVRNSCQNDALTILCYALYFERARRRSFEKEKQRMVCRSRCACVKKPRPFKV